VSVQKIQKIRTSSVRAFTPIIQGKPKRVNRYFLRSIAHGKPYTCLLKISLANAIFDLMRRAVWRQYLKTGIKSFVSALPAVPTNHGGNPLFIRQIQIRKRLQPMSLIWWLPSGSSSRARSRQ
jgi:hypothetical protein